MCVMKLWTTFVCDLKWASFWLNINTHIHVLHIYVHFLYMSVNPSHQIMSLLSQLHVLLSLTQSCNICTKHEVIYILLHVNTLTPLKLFRYWNLSEYKSRLVAKKCIYTCTACKKMMINVYQYFLSAKISKNYFKISVCI